MMNARELSLEDIIAAEVRRAAATVSGAPAQSAGGIGGIDIKGITTLLGEINKLMANTGAGSPGGVPGNAPNVITAQPAPQPQIQPAQNPAPQPAKKPNPEKVYSAIYDTLGKLMSIMGDVKLSEVRAFMDENREMVVSVIGSNMDGLDL